MTILGSKKGAKREPKCSQKRSKIEAEIEDEKGRSLGPCLGRLGVVLVLTLESKILKHHWFLYIFVKNHVFEQSKVWNGIFCSFWADIPSTQHNKTYSAVK